MRLSSRWSTSRRDNTGRTSGRRSVSTGGGSLPTGFVETRVTGAPSARRTRARRGGLQADEEWQFIVRTRTLNRTSSESARSAECCHLSKHPGMAAALAREHGYTSLSSDLKAHFHARELMRCGSLRARTAEGEVADAQARPARVEAGFREVRQAHTRRDCEQVNSTGPVRTADVSAAGPAAEA